MIYDTRDEVRHNTCKPTTIGVATPTQQTIKSADEPRIDTRHDAGKQTPSIATPTLDSIYRADGPRDAMRHDLVDFEPTLNVTTLIAATPNSNSKSSLETPYDTMLTNRPKRKTKHYADRPTPSIATPIVATPIQDSKKAYMIPG
jgi:hypothetical protein